MRKAIVVLMAIILFSFFHVNSLFAQIPGDTPVQNADKALIKDIGIDQKLGDQIPLDLTFRDEQGQEHKLRDYFGKRPVIIAPVYFNCPMLCTLILNGLIESLNVVTFKAGTEFDVLAVSFDPRENATLATEKKKTYLAHYNKKNTEAGWHFLTGDETNVKALMNAIGFRYKYDAVRDQYSHASGVMVATPEGKLARYFYGIDYIPRDVRLGLVEASENKIGSPVDQILLLCYHYDPSTGKYGPLVMNLIRLGGAITVLGMALFLFLMFRSEKRRQKGWAKGEKGLMTEQNPNTL